jgi:uncharacterized ion transporter superfamily protein YfcC
LFTGIEYRSLCWVIITTAGIAMVLFYASGIRKNPQRSPMFEADEYWRNRGCRQILNTWRWQKSGLLNVKSPAGAVGGKGMVLSQSPL